MTVLILRGGDSPEREVSFRSGDAVEAALIEAGYNVIVYDPADGNVGLEKSISKADIVLPILHGKNGEDGVIQEQIEQQNKKFLGAGSKVSKVTIDKNKTHKILSSMGIVMPKYAIVDALSFNTEPLSKKPFVLKPLEGGSSIGTLIAREVNSTNLAMAQELLSTYKKMIIEELIIGQEITVPVLGEQALPVIGIIPPPNGEFDYDNKYNGQSQELCPVPTELVSEKVQKEAQDLALKVHNVLNVRHLSRTDMFAKPDGSLVVLEINTMPGLTAQSLFPLSASVAGMSMVQLVGVLVNLVVHDS